MTKLKNFVMALVIVLLAFTEFDLSVYKDLSRGLYWAAETLFINWQVCESRFRKA